MRFCFATDSIALNCDFNRRIYAFLTIFIPDENEVFTQATLIVSMNRLLALLLPLAIVSTGAVKSRAPSGLNPEDMAKFWSDSVTAESAKNYDDAIKQTVSFQQGGGDKYLSALRYAYLLHLKADYQKSAEMYATAAKLQPMALAPALGLLSAAQGLNDAAKIRVAAENILKAEPTNYRAQMAMAGLLFVSREYRRSLSNYRRALASYPGDLDALSGAAWSAFYLGEKREALDYFQQLMSISPDYTYARKGYELSAAPSLKP